MRATVFGGSVRKLSLHCGGATADAALGREVALGSEAGVTAVDGLMYAEFIHQA